jgi:hypothetical protein
VVIVLATEPKVRRLKLGRRRWIFKGDKSTARLPSEGKQSRQPHVVRSYGMLKIPAEYDKDTSPAKLTDIYRQVSPCFVTTCVCWHLPALPAFVRNDLDSDGDAQYIRKWPECMGRFVRYYLVQ